MTTAVESMLEILRSERVDRIFGNPGTTELPFTDALVGVSDLQYVLGVHEGPVVAMADGYARATRRTSFVNLHVAAGVANGLIGMLNARRSRTPMVVTAGQQDRRHLLQDPMLSGDLVGLARAAAKEVHEVQHVYDLPTVLRRAFARAAEPPAGPVFVSIPMDVLMEDTPVPVLGRSVVHPPAAAGGTDEAAELMAAARRPVIVAGDGVGRDRAMDALVRLAEAWGAPVYHQPMADGVNFPGNHPLFAGMLMPTNADIRRVLEEHDTLLVVGTHAFMPHHYTPEQAVPEKTAVVQLDTDAAEIGRNFPVAAGLVGGLTPTLALLAERLRERVPADEARHRTEEAAGRHTAERERAEREALDAYGAAPLHPAAAAHAVAAGLPEGAVVVEEAITTGMRLRRVLRQDRPGSYVHTVGGGLGWGIGAAVGHRLGDPERPVVAVLGDGCAMFGLQGLWTAARYRVPAAFVVMSNGEYRTLKDTLDHMGSRSSSAGQYVGLDLGLDAEPGPARLDWTAAARFFGVASVRVESAEHLRETVARAGRLDGPLLIEAPILGHDEM